MKRLHTIWIAVYAVLLVVGSALAVFDISLAPWLFAAGAVLAIAQTFTYSMQHKTSDIGQSRIQRLNFVASLFLGIGAWYMFQGNNSWVVMTIVYLVLVLYLSFRTKDESDSKS